ncbi:MAG: hypothetical protein WAO58_05180 [Fimbriimonadaceae bacterium]
MAAADAMNTLSALRLAEEAAAIKRNIPGVHVLRAQCLAGLGRLHEARSAAAEEQTPEAAQLLRSIQDAIRAGEETVNAERQWASVIKPDVLRPIEAASHRYTYRGHALIKNPFDFALSSIRSFCGTSGRRPSSRSAPIMGRVPFGWRTPSGHSASRAT